MRIRSDCSAHRNQCTIPITEPIAIRDLNENHIKAGIAGITKKKQLQSDEAWIIEEIEERNVNGKEIQKSMEKYVDF